MSEKKNLHKTVSGGSIQWKQEEEGRFSAVFATLDVIDHDGDVIMPGAIENGKKVKISAYNHSSWGDNLPVGKGTISEQNGELIVDGQFFLDTEAGKETYRTVKNLEDLAEYSFGFNITANEFGERDGQQVQFIKGLDIFEVSPVLRGAGIGTRTLSVKHENVKQAIPRHDASTTDREWDAGAQEDRLTNDGSYSVYRNMYAWVDPEGDRENKTSYKFPHHMVDGDGMPGAANTRACIAAIAALNGARGGADIPAGDRRGVWNHVGKHLRDAGEEPPELEESASAEESEQKGERFADQANRVREDVGKLVERCRDIAEMRKQKGKSKVIGDEAREQIVETRDNLYKLAEEIDSILEDDEEELIEKLLKEKIKEITDE